MSYSPKVYVRHRRDKRLYDRYIRHIKRPEWRSDTSGKYDTQMPLTAPSFGSAVAWIRKHRHVINTAILLLRLYPHVIRDDCLNSLWDFLKPYLDECVHEQNNTGRKSSDSDISVISLNTAATPQFVEFSFPVRTMSSEDVHNASCSEKLRFTHSATSVRKSSSASKRHQHYLSSDVTRLPCLSRAQSRNSPCKSKRSVYLESGYTSPVMTNNHLAPPPITMSNICRCVHQHNSHTASHLIQGMTEIPALQPLPPVKSNDNNTKLKGQWSIDSMTSPSVTNHVAANRDGDVENYLVDDGYKGGDPDPDFYRETTYLVSRDNSVDDVSVVHWPPRKEESNRSSNNNSPWDDSESEVSFPLNKTYIDINIWSGTPIEGVDGELE